MCFVVQYFMKKCIVSIAKQISSSCRLCVIVSEFDVATQERVQTCIVRSQTETVPCWRTVDQLADHRSVTHTQTHRHTTTAYTVLSIASRGKN